MNRAGWTSGAASLLLITGCNSILGITDLRVVETSVDARPDGAPMSKCGPLAPPNTVVGCGVITHLGQDGAATETRRDFSHVLVSAYLPDESAAGFTIVNGTGTADGTFRIDGVPDGTTYYLRLLDPMDPLYQIPHFYQTDQHDLDLGLVVQGRTDTPVSQRTNITINATGLSPWNDGDDLRVDSFAAGADQSFFPTTDPAAGATSVATVDDWSSTPGSPEFFDVQYIGLRPQAIDTTAAHGDDLWILHETATTTRTGRQVASAVTPVDYARPAPVTIVDGAAQTITAAFQKTPVATGKQSVSFALTALRAALHDGGALDSESADCVRLVSPGNGQQGRVLWLSITPDPSATTASASDVAYDNPYPASWKQLMTCSFSHIRHFIGPSDAHVSAVSFINYFGPAIDNVDYQPTLKTPDHLMIDGRPGLPGGHVSFDGTRPVVLSWDPVAGISHYSIRVRSNVQDFTAVFDTKEPSVTMPADVFTKDGFYVIRVAAVQSSADFAGGALVDVSAPAWIARTSTGMFRFSSSCGDGIKDPSEDCDTGPGGDTKSCDDDCTFPVCGDGYVNVAAGEKCDDAVDTPRCDGHKRCTPPTCGDGYRNATVEECDDGGTVSGDGCSATCTVEH